MVVMAFKDRLSKFHQMGLTDEKDIVSLIEGLTLGKAYRESLELEKTSSAAPVVFDNSYFVNLMTRDIDNVALVDHTFGKLPDHLLIEIFIRVPVLDWPHINCVKQQWGRFL